MRADRRHELRENDLAHMLGQVQDFLARQGRSLVVGAITVAAVFLVVMLVVRTRTVNREDQWRRRYLLTFDSPETGRESVRRLMSLARESSDELFVRSALLDAGGQALRLTQVAPNPPDEELNGIARTAFEELLRRNADHPLVVGVARMGLATVAQNTFVLDGRSFHAEEARQQLGALVAMPALEVTPLYRQAVERLDQLDEVFRMTDFAAAPVTIAEPEGPTPGAQPSEAEPTVIRQRLQIRPDGTFVPVEPQGGAEPAQEPADSAPSPEKTPDE